MAETQQGAKALICAVCRQSILFLPVPLPLISWLLGSHQPVGGTES